jgi:hypothetical protein
LFGVTPSAIVIVTTALKTIYHWFLRSVVVRFNKGITKLFLNSFNAGIDPSNANP